MRRRGPLLLLLVLAAPALLGQAATTPLVVSADQPCTVAFPASEARFVRLVITASTGPQPCIDELEVYGPESGANLALAASGAVASASSCLAGFAAHAVTHLNDGRYGNDFSWIPTTGAEEWAQIELPAPAMVDRVVLSRDRDGRYADRLPTSFEVRLSPDGQTWRTARRVGEAVVVQIEQRLIRPDKPNVLDFVPQEARFVRVAIDRATVAQPCIDELEVYGEDAERNLAAAALGAKPSASSCIEGYPIHRVEHLNDGGYGNDRSWIAATTGAEWAQIELPEAAVVRRVVISRDRDGMHRDRLPADFRVQVSTDGQAWTTVKRIAAIENAPIDQPLPGEDPRDWAERVAAELPEGLQADARALVAGVRTMDDVKAVLALREFHLAREDTRQQLSVRFNPAALRRAVADLRETFPNQFQLPEGFEATLAAHEARLPEVLRILESGTRAEVEGALAEAAQMMGFARDVLMANPLLDFGELLVLKRGLPKVVRSDVYWLWGQRYGMPVNWSCDFRPKNPPVAEWWDDELAALDLRSGLAQLRTIYRAEPGHMLQHPELDFDAGRLLFTAPGADDAFQVFEIGVDGTGLRQVTPDLGADIDNGDAVYLPNGRIAFNSTAGFIGVPCEDGESYVSNLCLTDADGTNVRMLTNDQESNWYPVVLNDGRVMYTRYEYANIGHQFGRLLFTMNPDGTEQFEYYGSQSYWPNSVFYARPVPNDSSKVVGIVCGHHGPNRTGPLVLFDPQKGRHETDGALQMIPGYGKPVQRIVEDELYASVWPKFVHPWPLSDRYFLVAGRLHPGQPQYAIYLVDVFDNVTEVCRMPDASLLEPIPLKARPRPPLIPDRTKPGVKDASIALVDIYRGPGLEGVPRGSVRALRVYTYSYVYRHTLARGFGHLATPGVDGPWEPRTLLGTVPVSEDGSAFFRVPANTPVSVQPIDEHGRALQTMRSWYTAMPGETVSCVGCHVPMGATPAGGVQAVVPGEPDPIEPWRGPVRGFDYELEVQPVLDRHCVGCHDGAQPGRPDLARKSEEQKLAINQAYHAATESTITTTLTPSFIALHPYVRRPHAESHLGPRVPGEYLADTSPLVQMLRKGHHNVRLDDEAWDRLYTWIDLGAPDQGSWKHSEWGVPANYHQRRLEMWARLGGRTDDVEWMPAPGPVPDFVAPEPEAPAEAAPECPGWPFDAAEAARRQQAAGLPATRTVELPGGLTMDFVLVPAGEFVMGDGGGGQDERPLGRVTVERPFYLSRTEVTNAQFAALVDPRHDSGFEDWRSIDWRGEGYALTDPAQPAVRVSWYEAVRFAEALAEQLGEPAGLPTEAQWEWACRAGSGEPLWYGGLDADFGPLENLAGREQRRFAFDGKPKWYLRDDRFDDGALVTAAVGSYRPNAWGLCDMAGNAAEWTRTAYRPYPYDASDGRESLDAEGERVVRGGSWYVKPGFARSGFRWKYAPWLRVHDVGFRVVVGQMADDRWLMADDGWQAMADGS